MNTPQRVAAYHLTKHMAGHDHPYPDLKLHTFWWLGHIGLEINPADDGRDCLPFVMLSPKERK